MRQDPQPDSVTIPLINGGTAIVSPEDYPEAIKFVWWQCRIKNRVYARDKANRYLQRLVKPGEPGQLCVFLNNNTLDCRRENLALVDRAAFCRNLRKRR